MYKKSNEELYFELKEKMFEVLESEDFYQVFNNSIRSGKNNISLYQRYMNSVIDIKWVEKIEDSLIALDNIIRNPQRFIKETEEVIPIEQVKKVSENSIRHHGGMDGLCLAAFFDAALNKTDTPIDAYDVAAWMAITCLSEDSIAMGSMPVAIPDFTYGKWINRKPPVPSKYSLEDVFEECFETEAE